MIPYAIRFATTPDLVLHAAASALGAEYHVPLVHDHTIMEQFGILAATGIAWHEIEPALKHAVRRLWQAGRRKDRAGKDATDGH